MDNGTLDFPFEDHAQVEEALSARQFTINRSFTSYAEAAPDRPRVQTTDTVEEATEAFEDGKSLMVIGAGGCGKSSWLVERAMWGAQQRLPMAVVAMTGKVAKRLAAEMQHSDDAENLLKRDMPNPTTVHAGLHIRPGDEHRHFPTVKNSIMVREEARRRRMIKQKKRYTAPIPPKIIIIDEIGMCNYKLLALIRFLYPDAQIVATGDFFQLPPVQGEHDPPAAGMKVIHDMDLVRSLFGCNVFRFTKNHRMLQAGHAAVPWLEMLASMRVKGKLTDRDIDLLESTACRKVTPEHLRLFATNKEVNACNDEFMQDLIASSGADRVTLRPTVRRKITEHRASGVTDAAAGDGAPASRDCAEVPPTLESKLTIELDKHHDLDLCVGCVVMLTANLSIRKGLINGSRGIVVGFAEGGDVIVKFDDHKGGNQTIVRRETWQEYLKTEDGARTYTVSVLEFPLQRAWALTVHKAIGLTIPKLFANVSQMGKKAGMVYVVLSRSDNSDGVIIEGAEALRDVDMGMDDAVEFEDYVTELELERREAMALEFEGRAEQGDDPWALRGAGAPPFKTANYVTFATVVQRAEAYETQRKRRRLGLEED